MPTVDVMLPFYGDAEHFRLAVHSVLSQDMSDFRLVCVDDAYPSDEPREWLDSLKDPRLVYIRNETNLGVAGNFARCLDLVEAPWFVMMGGDDIMHPEYLTTVLDLVRREHCVVAQPGVKVIDAHGRAVAPVADRVKKWIRPRVGNRPRLLASEQMARSLSRGDWAYFPSLLWRTESVRSHGFTQEYEIALDLALLFDLALNDGSMVIGRNVCFSYRRHSSSASSVTAVDGLRFVQERELFEAYADRFSQRGWHRAARIARRGTLSRLNATLTALAVLRTGNVTGARRLLRTALG